MYVVVFFCWQVLWLVVGNQQFGWVEVFQFGQQGFLVFYFLDVEVVVGDVQYGEVEQVFVVEDCCQQVVVVFVEQCFVVYCIGSDDLYYLVFYWFFVGGWIVDLFVDCY